MRISQNIIPFFLILVVSSNPVHSSEAESKTAEDYSRKPSENFIQQWESMMSDFTPEDILTFMVHGYESDVMLIHDVSPEDVNATFKGAYFIHNEKQTKAEVKIFTPKGKLLYKSAESEAIFDFQCSFAGQYQIIILNKERKSFKITLATHFFNEKINPDKDVNYMEQKLQDSMKNFKSLMTESKFTQQQRKSQTAFVESAYNRILWMNVLETLIIVAVTGGQIYFIQKLLNFKITV